MRVCLILTFLMLLSAGCGEKPVARFVYSERTEGLMKEAREGMKAEDGTKLPGVKETLDKYFGTPQHLVAWERFPIDYGRYEGEVKKVTDNEAPYRFTVKFTEEIPESENLHALGLLWTSGAYAVPVFNVTKNGEDDPHKQAFSFQSQNYVAESGELAVNAKLGPGVKAGDKFAVVGHTLQKGRMLYMTHCLHCHGVSGDGGGPTAPYLNPRPRDYRRGIFKFTSTMPRDRARRDDLERVVKYGIPGTYMPSFLLLTEEELHATMQYVLWLSFRGQLEEQMVIEMEASQFSQDAVNDRTKDGDESKADIVAELETYLRDDFPGLVDEAADAIAREWTEENSTLIKPDKRRTADSLESRMRGKALFSSAKAKCTNCHGPTARGDGPQTEDYEAIPGSKEKFADAGLHDTWGNSIKPRNLTRGIYRGGRRPIDIYRRIYAGIKGTPMPASNTVLKDEEIWDLVNFVLSVPLEADSVPAKTDTKKSLAAGSMNDGGN